MKRLLSLLIAVVLALLSAATPAAPTEATRVGEHIGSVVYDLTHKDEFSPFEQKTGPPTLALSTIQHGRPRWVFNQFIPSFVSSLQTTLVPDFSVGSGTPTFTRATTAYQTDFEGKLNAVLSGEARFQGARRVENLLTYTEDFSNAAWTTIAGGTGTAPTKTANYAAAPDGSITATRVQATIAAGTGAGDYSLLRQTLGVAAPSFSLKSAWIKSTTGLDQNILIFGYGVPTIITVGAVWKRFSAGTAGADSSTFDVGCKGSTAADKTIDILIWHPQLENVIGQTNQNPSKYVSVGVLSAPYHGAGVDGVQYFNYLNGNTVTNNVVTEATGAPIVSGQSGVSASAPVNASGPYGYLAEGARTNYALWSRDLTNAVWVNTNDTMHINAIGVDGVANSATALAATAPNATILQSITLASQANVFQPFVKRGSGTGEIDITIDNGVTWTNITSLINSSTFTQVSVTKTAANPVIGFRIVTSGDAIVVDMADMQNGTFASTPFPTTTIAVTRNADQLTYPLASNFSDTAGTMYGETYQTSWANASGSGIGSATQGMMPISTNSGVQGYDGTNTVQGAVGVPSGLEKMAVGWVGSTMTVTASGGAVSSGSYDGTWNLTTLGIGTGGFGTWRKVEIWPAALSSPRLILQTTDAASWLGDPWWNVAANDSIYRKVTNK